MFFVLGGAKKRPELLHGIMQQSNQNESTEKHVFNEQTYPNKSRNFRLKHFCISHDTNEIVLHIKQCLRAVHHSQATQKRHSNHQSID